MTGLDTNVLVRHIMQDDPLQSTKATRIIERHLTEKDPGFISLATMIESAWVLENIYGLSRQELAQAIETILQIETFVVQNEKEVHDAMFALRTGQGSFGDTLIGSLGSWAGCGSTLTFDRKASRLKGFKLIA
jgi:predicted nucleic-acid-binding protein